MKRQAYYPSRAADEVVWLTNCRGKLIQHTPVLGIPQAKCDAGVADCGWLIYILVAWLPALRAWSKACTEAVEAARSGEGAANMVLPIFVPPPLPAAIPGPPAIPAVVPRPPAALKRIFDTMQDIVESDTCTDAIKFDLMLIGAELGAPDYNILAPLLKLKIIGNQVFIDWSWLGFSPFLDQCEIQVDRGAGYGVLTFDTTPGYTDTTPGYTDTTPFPAQPTKWKYRAIYRVDDQQVGQWSPEVSVTVG